MAPGNPSHTVTADFTLSVQGLREALRQSKRRQKVAKGTLKDKNDAYSQLTREIDRSRAILNQLQLNRMEKSKFTSVIRVAFDPLHGHKMCRDVERLGNLVEKLEMDLVVAKDEVQVAEADFRRIELDVKECKSMLDDAHAKVKGNNVRKDKGDIDGAKQFKKCKKEVEPGKEGDTRKRVRIVKGKPEVKDR